MAYYKSSQPKTMQTALMTEDQTYNGWANYETWNVALWIGNDEFLYNVARRCSDYKRFAQRVSTDDYGYEFKTPDGVSFNDPKLDIEELNEMIDEMWD